MAIKGLSIPVVGKYNHDGAGNVTYTDELSREMRWNMA